MSVEAQLVVTISRNEPLQKMRTQVLEGAGFAVVPLTHDAEVIAFLQTDHHPVIRLVLVCHSVPEPSRVTLCDEFKKRYPLTPVLLLYNGYEPTKARVDGSIQNVNSPKALLDMIGFLTTRMHGEKAND